MGIYRESALGHRLVSWAPQVTDCWDVCEKTKLVLDITHLHLVSANFELGT